jgi:hypothetical protein
MKGLMISAFAAVALLTVVATMRLRPSSVDISLGSAAMPSLELHTTAGVDKLPFQESGGSVIDFPDRRQARGVRSRLNWWAV